MGQYKVPQNVEAEDKILGPLTFKEFIYFLMAFFWAAICFGIFRKVPILMILVGGPPTTLLLLLAFYNKDGQSFEQLLLAMVQFFAANRKRVWVKDELVETFHVEPTKVALEQTQRNPAEVRSELEKLANLIDSRGWNEPPQPESNLTMPTTQHAERIVPPPTPQAPGEAAPTDMLDLQQSPLAQNLAELLRTAAEDVRAEALQQMNGRSMAPATATAGAPAPAPISTSAVTVPSTGDILQLATQSDDLTVSQIARQATRLVQLPNGQTVELPANGS